MPKTTRKHPFKTSALIRERDELLSGWLNPHSPNTKVIDGLSPTFKQLAHWLSMHFEISPELSEGAVRRYVKDLRSDDTSLETRKAGRGKTVKSQQVAAPTKRPLGRPMKADNCIKAFDATFLAQLTAEAVQLTGLSPNTFYQTFSKQGTWKKFLGARSGFFYRLQKKLDAKHLASDSSSLRPDADVEHSLRLYQLTLPTLDGLWCAVVLAYEPRTHFLNAACYVAYPENPSKQFPRLPGRPIEKINTDWRLTLTTHSGHTSLHVPAELLFNFVINTIELIEVPVGAIQLSTTLGNHQELVNQFQIIAPEGHYSTIPTQHQPFIPPETSHLIRVTKLCRLLENLLNSHYEETAFSRIVEYQKRLDLLIEKYFHIQRPASVLLRYKERKRDHAFRESDALEAQREKAKELVGWRNNWKVQSHVKHRLCIDTEHLICEGY